MVPLSVRLKALWFCLGALFILAAGPALAKPIYVGIYGFSEPSDAPFVDGKRESFDFKERDPLNTDYVNEYGMSNQGTNFQVGTQCSCLDYVPLMIKQNAAADLVARNFPPTSVDAVVNWLLGNYQPGDRVYLAGHGAGAAQLMEVLQRLDQYGVEVEGAAFWDYTGPAGSQVPANVNHAYNFYQTQEDFHGAESIQVADPGQTRVLSRQIPGPITGPNYNRSWDPSDGHRNMDNDYRVCQTTYNYFMNAPFKGDGSVDGDVITDPNRTIVLYAYQGYVTVTETASTSWWTTGGSPNYTWPFDTTCQDPDAFVTLYIFSGGFSQGSMTRTKTLVYTCGPSAPTCHTYSTPAYQPFMGSSENGTFSMSYYSTYYYQDFTMSGNFSADQVNGSYSLGYNGPMPNLDVDCANSSATVNITGSLAHSRSN